MCVMTLLPAIAVLVKMMAPVMMMAVQSSTHVLVQMIMQEIIARYCYQLLIKYCAIYIVLDMISHFRFLWECNIVSLSLTESQHKFYVVPSYFCGGYILYKYTKHNLLFKKKYPANRQA